MNTPQIYGFSQKQEGNKKNEDAFEIIRCNVPLVILADGAGRAGQVAKKAINQFKTLLKAVDEKKYLRFISWKGWMKTLDSNLMGGEETTFTAVSIIGKKLVGVNVGDNKIYRFDYKGEITTITSGMSKKRLGSGEIDPTPIHCYINGKEIFSLMTDGAWTPLGNYKIKKLFQKRLSYHPADFPSAIIQESSRYGKNDDMTVINIYF
jgi:serine/threonine protein phosphatase PrpC